MSRRPTNPPPLRSIDRVLYVGGNSRQQKGTAEASTSGGRAVGMDEHAHGNGKTEVTEKHKYPSGYAEFASAKQKSNEMKAKRKAQPVGEMQKSKEMEESKEKEAEMKKQRVAERKYHLSEAERTKLHLFGDDFFEEQFQEWRRQNNQV